MWRAESNYTVITQVLHSRRQKEVKLIIKFARVESHVADGRLDGQVAGVCKELEEDQVGFCLLGFAMWMHKSCTSVLSNSFPNSFFVYS